MSKTTICYTIDDGGKGPDKPCSVVSELEQENERLKAELALLEQQIMREVKNPKDIVFYESDGTERTITWDAGDESVGIFPGYGPVDTMLEDLKAELSRQRETIRELGMFNGRMRNGLKSLIRNTICGTCGVKKCTVVCRGSDACIDLIINAANDGGM